MIKKLLSLSSIFLLVLLFGIFSCDNCGPFPDKLKVVSINWEMFESIFDGTSVESHLIEDDKVVYNKLSFLIEPDNESYFSSLHKNTFNCINSAYACDPVIPESSEIISDIRIYSDTDYRAGSLLAGENMAPVFDIIVFDYFHTPGIMRYDLQEYLANYPLVPDHMYLMLKIAPDQVRAHQFRIELYLDGEEFDYFEKTFTTVIVLKNGTNGK